LRSAALRIVEDQDAEGKNFRCYWAIAVCDECATAHQEGGGAIEHFLHPARENLTL
jgi:hypothetical protein